MGCGLRPAPFTLTMKIKFIKSPGYFNLAYFVDDEVYMPETMANTLVESGYAVKLETMVQPMPEVEIPEKRRGRKPKENANV